MVSRLIAFPLLLGAAACASAGNSAYRNVLSPQDGPKAKVYASYSGGVTNRTVRTSFHTDKNAHVLVGRLSGDGTIEILYPENPQSETLIRGGKTYQARSFGAIYDGYPQRYSYASRSPRSYGARVDSYDGRGNGFIFIIATENPMFTELLDDHGSWSDSLEVDDYYSSYDPRYAIKDLAETLTRGMPYSLDYADSFGTNAYTSYADMAMDCQMLGISGLGYGYGDLSPAFGGFGGSAFDSFAWYFMRPPMYHTYGHSSVNPCGFNRYYAFNRFGNYFAFNTGWSRGPIYIPTVGGPIIPPSTPAQTPAPLSPSLRRPGFRNTTDANPALSVARARIDRPSVTTKASSARWAPPIQGTAAAPDRPNRTYRPSNSNQGYVAARSQGNSRSDGVSTRSSTPSSGATSAARPATSTATSAARPAPAPAPAAPKAATSTATATTTKKQ